APVVLLGAYFYYHLYLQRIWDAVAELPAIFPDGRSVDKKVPSWLVSGLLHPHFRHLRHRRPPLSGLQRGLSIFASWWLVPVTLLFFWGRYLRRHDWVGTGLHIAVIVLAIGAGELFYRLAMATLRGER